VAKIGGIIDDTPQMPDMRKEYLKRAIGIRYDLILAPALKRLNTI
jgi:hypothetical protein